MNKLILSVLSLFMIISTHTSAQEIGASWNFNEDGNSEGWTINRSLTDLTVADGLLTATISGYQSSFAGPDSLNIAANEYGFIYVRMQVNEGLWGKVFWKTDSGKSESVIFNIIGDSLFHEYEIPVSSKEKWADTITEFSKFQIQAPIGSEIKIDYIRVMSLGLQFEITYFKPLRTVLKQNESIPLIASVKNIGSYSGSGTAHLILPDQIRLISGDLEISLNELNVWEADTLCWAIQTEITGDYQFGLELTWGDTNRIESRFEMAVVDKYWKMDSIILSTWGKPEQTEDGYAEYVNAHFNKILHVAPNASEVEWAASHGLECMINVYEIFGGSPYLRGFDDQPAYKMTEEILANVDPIIEQFRDNPTVFGYYICDEPCANAFDNLAMVVAYLREKDPNRLAYINLYPCYGKQEHFGEYSYEEYVERFLDIVKPELLSYDHYHFKVGEDGIEYFYNLELIRKYARCYNIPFCNIIQGQSIPSLNGRTPTNYEYRYLNYSTLACGGKGIAYYAWYRMKADPTFDTVIFPAVQKLNQEIQALNPVLFGLRSEAVYHTNTVPAGCSMLPSNTLVKSVSDNAELTIGFFKDENESDYLMFMNRDYLGSATATITLNRFVDYVEYLNVETGNWQNVVIEQATDGTTFNFDFLPGGGALFKIGQTTSIDQITDIENNSTFVLEKNYPNPFNPSTTIRYSLPQATNVKLMVYDMIGREITVLVNTKQNAGNHSVVWDAQDLPSGLYVCRLEAGSVVQNRKMLLLK